MFKKLLASAVVVGACASANAGVITSATSAVINHGGPGFGSIANTYNQNGLSSTYISGVTDFATFLATKPLHAVVFGSEWFSDLETESASVTYKLGAAKALSALALWNEESGGIGSLNLSYSLDGVNFTALAANLVPSDHGLIDYPADVFAFATVNAQYIRLDMSACPQFNEGMYPGCSIGEVAFDVNVNAVPEPASLGLIGLGLAGLAFRRRRAA